MVRNQLLRLRDILRRTLDSLRLPKSMYCCICEKKVGAFFSYRGGKRAPLMVALETVGSNVDQFGCPYCKCHDRERHLYLYMQAEGLMEAFRGASILHFAPEARLSTLIERQQPERYTRADLFPTSPDVEKIDMLDIAYPDASFDFVIANHVLEHVDNDLQALSELRRILKPGGRAILQTPYSNKLHKIFSDPGIDNDFARFQAYGQEDHVRLYGTDIFSRIESAGFHSRVASHEEKLGHIDPRVYGVNALEPLFLYERADD